MGKRKKEKKGNQDNQDIELIPLVEDEIQQDEKSDNIENIENDVITEENSSVKEPADSTASELFGAYVTAENKWERKNRLREEKDKKKEAKKRAKYKDVDDETYESMKARPGHVLFGVICIMLVLAGLGLSTLGIYRLAVNPAYAKVGEAEKNLQVDGLATDGDAASSDSITVLQGISTPSDLVDTWEEQKFATPSDADVQETTQEETTQTDEPSESE